MSRRDTVGLRASAWAVWLGAVCVYAVVVSNPLYLALGFAGVVLAHLGQPVRAGRADNPVRTFLVVGCILLVLRVGFVAFLGNQGSTTLLTVPRLEIPDWAGGFGVGGRITAELIIEALVEGSRFLLVLVAFGVVNTAVDAARAVRSLPPAFRDTALVVSIALAFVPTLLRVLGDVRDAQRLRGRTGLRTVAPSLVVPVLGITLERSFLLAESMEARGYGRSAKANVPPSAVVAGLVLVTAGLAIWTAGSRGLGTALSLAGLASLAAPLATAWRRMPGPQRRLTWGLPDVAVISAASACIAVAFVDDVGYSAYPRAALPPFELLPGVAALLLSAPALGPRARR